MTEKETQTSVQHSYWLKHLINIAKEHVQTINGMGVSKNDFFSIAAGEKATAMIKNSPALNYEGLKQEYERIHGAVSDYNTNGSETEAAYNDDAEEDTLLQEIKES